MPSSASRCKAKVLALALASDHRGNCPIVVRRSIPLTRYMAEKVFLPCALIRRCKPGQMVSANSSRPIVGGLAFVIQRSVNRCFNCIQQMLRGNRWGNTGMQFNDMPCTINSHIIYVNQQFKYVMLFTAIAPGKFAKVGVEGSNPFARSIILTVRPGHIGNITFLRHR